MYLPAAWVAVTPRVIAHGWGCNGRRRECTSCAACVCYRYLDVIHAPPLGPLPHPRPSPWASPSPTPLPLGLSLTRTLYSSSLATFLHFSRVRSAMPKEMGRRCDNDSSGRGRGRGSGSGRGRGRGRGRPCLYLVISAGLSYAFLRGNQDGMGQML